MAYHNHQNKELDIVVYGATGYTGRLVAEYLADRYAGGDIAWAMAGRSREKLEQVRDAIGAPAQTPLIVANSDDPASLDALCGRTKVVITTVGPYTLYGEALLKACAEAGTDYVDLSGEAGWIRQMVDAYADRAAQTGARIVCSCGFDSIPFDLGVHYLQRASNQRFGALCRQVRGRVRAMKGTFSGGTAESVKVSVAAAMKHPALLALLQSPFALAPGFDGPRQPSGDTPLYEDDLDSWAAPFIMAPINTKNVHRTNALTGHAYGEDFAYSEMILTGPGEAGEAAAKAVAGDTSLMSEDAPKPGEGPTKQERDSGYYDVLFLGETADGRTLRASVRGDKDPGYGSTSKMIAESALCLIEDATDTPGGIWTAGAAMGDRLIDRLQKNAGLSFAIEEQV